MNSIQLSSSLNAKDGSFEKITANSIPDEGGVDKGSVCRDTAESICQLNQIANCTTHLLQPAMTGLLERATSFAIDSNCPIPLCADEAVCFGPVELQDGGDVIVQSGN
jgi:hypothetical protein